MKALIFLFLVSINSFASGWFPVGKDGAETVYVNSARCIEVEGVECFDVAACPLDECELIDNEVLDYISKTNETSCTDELDCDAKFIEISCSLDEEKIKNYDLLNVYCTKPIYKIDGKKLVESEEKKAAYKAARKAEKDLELDKKEAKKLLKLSIKEDIKNATTVAKLKALIEKLIEAQE